MLDSRWASIDAFAENNRDNILRDITRLVAVPSVEGTPEPGAPFGKGPKAALDKALEIASRNAHSRVRLEESETARQSFLPGLFVFRGGEKDFPEKSAKKSKYPLAIFP